MLSLISNEVHGIGRNVLNQPMCPVLRVYKGRHVVVLGEGNHQGGEALAELHSVA